MPKPQTQKTAVIVVAAGKGRRAARGGDDLPKQYRKLGGQTVIARSLAVFAHHPAIHVIQPVIGANDAELFAAALPTPLPKMRPPVTGGETRQESVWRGLRALEEVTPQWVLIHDGARPFLPASVIDRVVAALTEAPAVLPALPVADTLKRTDGTRVVDTVDRENLWAAQTPQGFHFSDILAAHKAAAKAKTQNFTDDAAIAEWAGLPVTVVRGSARNRKLTTAEDLAMAERELARETEMRCGQGFDVHAFGPGNQVVLCGVPIPHEAALVGHSDADVALHALVDAILGTIGAGDIGQLFPPSDPRWRGVASEVFVAEALARLTEAGGRLRHVDLTLICEAPKIAPHRETMRRRMAEMLHLPLASISLKATTTEGLGFPGRREGIAAQALVTVALPSHRDDSA